MKSPLILHPELETTPRDLEEILFKDRSVLLSDASRDAIEASQHLLHQALKEDLPIYGLTTGFGPLVEHRVAPGDQPLLQRNLVYHLASGSGEPMKASWVRAILLTRAICLARGYSAVRLSTLELLLAWLNKGLVPLVPRYGTVGASGDLTPLAHITLAMMGEGELLVDGKPEKAAPLLEKNNLPRLELADRDGLAMVNGTAAMTALAALASRRASRALEQALILSAAFAETLCARSDAFDPLLAAIRPHPGQKRVTARLEELLKKSRRLRRGSLPVQHPFKPSALPDTLQDPYTLRCIPQMLGAVSESIQSHEEIVTRELNSVTDNPVLDSSSGRIIHGGNFFGQPVALASDSLNQALIAIAVLAERQIARITDAGLSGFPNFLQPRQPGLQSGLMGAQVTASSLVARLRSLAIPLSIQSMPTNANNQDVNPMGTLAALRSHEILDPLFEILAILGICLAQAFHLERERLGADAGYSPAARQICARLATFSPPLGEDRPLFREIADLARELDRS